ncbi:FAD-dependent oxidoreductase domain-containing protein 2-like [Ornithodoros turicata]|uniref:FAD-dependent oxidoreductase domain-containing protein 2-like n=1 Tax=Ornithodoros turicata TaxID=34597 RepID=UPI0031392352
MLKKLTLSTIVLFSLIRCVVKSREITQHEYCVVGAGPAGLQMAYFLERSNRDYVVFERTNMSGSFFAHYPRHRRLISINKCHTGRDNPEFNLRHDWNSLLSDDPSLLFRHFSHDYFPRADAMTLYLDTYRRKLGLKVSFDTEIRNVHRLQNDSFCGPAFALEDQREGLHLCNTVLMANGMSKPNIPKFDGSDLCIGYESLSTNISDFENKAVLILGKGNSAFETAKHIYGVTSVVHMLSRSPPRFAWSTHYVGDLRATNNDLLDNYQLKSLDGLIDGPMESLRLARYGEGKIILQRATRGNSKGCTASLDEAPIRQAYDVVIRCLGFDYDDSMFSKSSMPVRGTGATSHYPRVSHTYESINVRGLFFLGAVTHSLDFEKSSGGFIHGFRYTVQALHRLLEYSRHGNPWPSKTFLLMDLLKVAVERINEAAAMYEMFGSLGDVFLIDRDLLKVTLLKDFPVALLSELTERTGHRANEAILLTMQYGANFSGPRHDTFRFGRAVSDVEDAHLSNFLHPIFYYYEDIEQVDKERPEPPPTQLRPKYVHHVLEDFLTDYTSEHLHVQPLRRFLETSLGLDFGSYSFNKCQRMMMQTSAKPLPLYCIQNLTFKKDVSSL